jgi:glycosyltransferase involved in cell wall biosynthesis
MTMPRLQDPSHVVMMGTSFETRGGIAAVLQTYRGAGLFDRWPMDYVATHRDGTGLEKLLRAIDGFLLFLPLLCRYPRAVLHVHSASRASFWRKSVFMAMAMLVRWPVIFHLHGGGFATFYDAECGPVRRAIVRFFLDRASCVVVVSERWCAWMHRVTRNPRVVSIANPVALPAMGAVAREPALVAFAGRCSEAKGVFDLLEAASALRARHPQLCLELAGDGDLAAVQRRAHELGIGDKVSLLGWIGGRRKENLFARASIFVLPSHAEGMPVSLLEAMAAGCAVIVSAVGGVPDVIVDGFNGLLVPAGDTRALGEAIERLIADPALAAQMGRAARATIASRFTPERSLARLEQVYAGLGVAREPAKTGDGRMKGSDPVMGSDPFIRSPRESL